MMRVDKSGVLLFGYTEYPAAAMATIRQVSPLGPRVLVEVIKQNNMTDAGLYLPEGAKESMQEAILVQVIEVACSIDERTGDETNVSGVPRGATVLISKHAGIRIPWNSDLRVVDSKDVLAVVQEMKMI